MKCRKCGVDILDNSIYCNFCGAKQILKTTHKPKSKGNGSGTIYQLPNKKYKVEVVLGYYKEDGKLKKRRRTKTFDKKKDAVAAVETLKASKVNPSFPSLYELYDTFCKTKRYDKLSQSQQDKLSYAWDKMKKIQLVRIPDLTIEQMQETIDERAKTYYPARDMKVLLSHLYTVAIQHGKESNNKSQYIELPDAPNAKREVFTDEDVAKLWDDYYGQTPEGAAEPHEFTGYILIMVYTGMRIGELFKIEKEKIFFNEKCNYMIGGEKTAAGIDREIVIPNSILQIVKHFYEANSKKLVQRNLDGFYKDYWETIDRLKIRHLPPQTCRHTFFTGLVSQKVHPALIAAMGGHAQYETAIDNYNRLPLDEKLSAANKL